MELSHIFERTACHWPVWLELLQIFNSTCGNWGWRPKSTDLPLLNKVMNRVAEVEIWAFLISHDRIFDMLQPLASSVYLEYVCSRKNAFLDLLIWQTQVEAVRGKITNASQSNFRVAFEYIKISFALFTDKIPELCQLHFLDYLGFILRILLFSCKVYELDSVLSKFNNGSTALQNIQERFLNPLAWINTISYGNGELDFAFGQWKVRKRYPRQYRSCFFTLLGSQSMVDSCEDTAVSDNRLAKRRHNHIKDVAHASCRPFGRFLASLRTCSTLLWDLMLSRTRRAYRNIP